MLPAVGAEVKPFKAQYKFDGCLFSHHVIVLSLKGFVGAIR